MSKIIGFLSHLDLNLYLFRAPIIKELVSKGHKVYAICPNGDKNDALRSLGCEVVNYEISRKGLNPFAELLTIKKIYEVIKPLDLDILQNFTAKPNIYGSIAGKKANIPLICNAVTGLGSFYIDDSFKSKVVKTIMNTLYKYANSKAHKCVFQNSDDMSYFVNSGFVEADKAVLIKSSGIDTEVFISQELFKNEKLNVLMVARAIWHKGIKEFYEAASLLKDLNLTFTLIGDTDEHNPSCANKEFLQIGNVKWLGHRDDIKEQIDMCDIFVLPSYREGVPRTLLEAASMGKPIVTTNAVGCREVVDDGVNGFLVPVKDGNALAEKIKILVEDENMRNKFGKASRKKAVEEFDVKVVVEQYLRLYDA